MKIEVKFAVFLNDTLAAWVVHYLGNVKVFETFGPKKARVSEYVSIEEAELIAEKMAPCLRRFAPEPEIYIENCNFQTKSVSISVLIVPKIPF